MSKSGHNIQKYMAYIIEFEAKAIWQDNHIGPKN